MNRQYASALTSKITHRRYPGAVRFRLTWKRTPRCPRSRVWNGAQDCRGPSPGPARRASGAHACPGAASRGRPVRVPELARAQVTSTEWPVLLPAGMTVLSDRDEQPRCADVADYLDSLTRPPAFGRTCGSCAPSRGCHADPFKIDMRSELVGMARFELAASCSQSMGTVHLNSWLLAGSRYNCRWKPYDRDYSVPSDADH